MTPYDLVNVNNFYKQVDGSLKQVTRKVVNNLTS